MTSTPVNDKWLRIVGITFLWSLSIIANDFHRQPVTSEVVIRMCISLVSLTITWHVIRAFIFYYRERFPTRQQIAKRLILTFLTGSLATTLIIWATAAVRYFIFNGTLANFTGTGHVTKLTINNTTISLNLLGMDLVESSIDFIFFQVIYETLFFARDSLLYQKKLKQAEQEKEMLRTANLQSQLDALKQQVNPHFLFNSLNVLDSLIDEDPQQARVFLDELSTVYRYLLRSNEHHLTDLNSELAFINSYFHLLKTRHGSGLSLNINVADQYQTYLLPPLTLQLLVENAVKHNIVLAEQPLIIEISTDAHSRLQIRNNIQRKSVRVASNGVGLSNILAKYQMLGQATPSIQEVDGQFVVTLRLLEASA